MTGTYVARQVTIGRPPENDDGDDAWGVAERIVVGWRILVVLPLICAAVGWAATFITAPKYTSVSTFVTVARDPSPNLGGLASMASQLGVGLPLSPNNSPQFYADVLRSREVVQEVLRAKILIPVSSSRRDSIPILDLYEDKDRPEPARMDRGVRDLLRESSVSVNPRTSIVELRVVSESQTGSALIVKQFLTVLNRFNLERRQSQAGARRRFLAVRLAEAKDSLGATERALQAFLEGNRQFRSAPALQARYDGLQRQLNTYQELYSNFRRDFENARVDEVNDTPLLTVIDSAAVPVRRSSPSRLLAALGGGMLGGFFAVTFLVATASLERLRKRRPQDYKRLLEIRQQFLATLGLRRAQSRARD